MYHRLISHRVLRVLVVGFITACGGDATSTGADDTPSILPPIPSQLSCSLPNEFLFSGVARDAIPALTNPTLVPIGDPGLAYLDAYAESQRQTPRLPELRVVGLVDDDRAVAIPYNILWWHEIVHIDLGGRRLAVTYCPLTGSAMVFDATSVGATFGVWTGVHEQPHDVRSRDGESVAADDAGSQVWHAVGPPPHHPPAR